MVPNPQFPGGISEFQYDPQLHKWLGDSCGDAMSAHMAAMAEGRKASVSEMLSIYNDLYNRKIAHHYELKKGGSTLSQQKDELEARGYKTALHLSYEDPFKKDWLGTLRQYAGKKPIGLFFTLAEKLVDAQTGIGYSYRKPWVFDPKHQLGGHFIAVIAQCPLGYICADGANPQVASRYAIYRADTLAAAMVHGLLMIEMRNGKVPAVSTNAYSVAADGTLVYPNGKLLGGFSDFVKSNNITADLDIPDTSFSPTESFCVFKDNRTLYWSQAAGVLDMGNCGVIVKSMYNRAIPVQPDMSKFVAELNRVVDELKAA